LKQSIVLDFVNRRRNLVYKTSIRIIVLVAIATPLIAIQFASPSIPSLVIGGEQRVFQFGWPFAAASQSRITYDGHTHFLDIDFLRDALIANGITCVLIVAIVFVYLFSSVLPRYPKFGIRDMFILMTAAAVCVVIFLSESMLYESLDKFEDFHNSTIHWGKTKPLVIGLVIYGYLWVSIAGLFSGATALLVKFNLIRG
jgi:hypothetical protein